VDTERDSAARLLVELRATCTEAGFDLVQPLQVGWYNAQVEGSLRLVDFGSPAHLGIVIGNTRALWPRFIAALRADPALLLTEHPLHAYTERALTAAVARLAVPVSLRWSHRGGAGLVAMQRLAQAAGLAYLAESQLSVHAEYGPWISLRAALSCALPGPPGPAPVLAHPCGACAMHCRPAFARACAGLRGTPSARDIAEEWQLWLACRDACPTGRAHRFGEAQIRYHYLKDRSELRRQVQQGAE
jgi:methylmalonic aciduria homocystinuria type C protein